MHGNEPLGPAVIKKFSQNPAVGVDTLVANEKAYVANCRFVKNDLNRSFPGNAKSTDYETKRASEILQICKNYDLVLDFHNTYCPNNNCIFVGSAAKKNLYSVFLALGLRRVIVADYDCINKYAPNCISVEISLDSKQNNPNLWYKKIKKLSKTKTKKKYLGLQKYKFVYRITNNDRDRLNLQNAGLKAFRKIPRELALSLGVKTPAYPIFIGDGYTPYNYGGLLSKIEENTT